MAQKLTTTASRIRPAPLRACKPPPTNFRRDRVENRARRAASESACDTSRARVRAVDPLTLGPQSSASILPSQLAELSDIGLRTVRAAQHPKAPATRRGRASELSTL